MCIRGEIENEASKRGEKVISGRLEDPHVEIEIGADQIAGTLLELLHAAIGVSDPVDRGVGVRPRRERRRLGLHHLTQHKELSDEVFRGVDCRCQESTSGSEHVPVRLGPDPSADLRPGDDHRLGGQHAIGFSQRSTGHRETRARIGRVRQERPRRMDPAHDLASKSAGEGGRILRSSDWATRSLH